MSIATQISRLQQAKADLKETIENYNGITIPSSDTIDDFPAYIDQTDQATLTVQSTTVRTSASATSNVATNPKIRIRGSDGNDYTLAEWNALFVAANYNKDSMTVTPIGLRVQAFNADEVYLFDRFTGVTYTPSGESAGAAGKLQHSLYNHSLVTAAASGTDYTTSKAWSVTASGDNLVLYEANTKQSWTMAKNCGAVYAHRAYNIADRTHSLWAQNEWLRHRMAISSGISTSKADGTTGDIAIYNASGSQAAVGEDMYFWIKNDSDTYVNTNILAKYNLNNRHTVNSAGLTSAIRDSIYNKQVANGINMNDTGVNSSSKPILGPGSKGAECIAVDGVWMIITPFISNPNATTATATNNVPDSPAIYWAKYNGCSLPSDSLLWAMYNNRTLCDAIVTYLNSKEGRSIPTIPTGDYIWTAVRGSAVGAWIVSLNGGGMYVSGTCNRYFVCGASAS